MPKKYFIASDLHLEFRQGEEEKFWKQLPRYPEARVCICAGDVTTFGLPLRIVYEHFRELVNRFDTVLYVPGNHEYYGSSVDKTHIELNAVEEVFPNLHVLRAGNPFTFDGQRFLGDTMWFPDRPEVHMYRNMINDYSMIKELFPWAFTQSQLFLNYLQERLREDDIIITHHIPSDVDTSLIWKGSQTQAYFVNQDCHHYLEHKDTVKPKAWIYGHTHDYHRYDIGKTKFICNPLGYPSENPSWTTRQFVYEL